MKILQAWSLLATFAAGMLPISVLAGVCDPPHHKMWNISSQGQLDALSECTTLDGGLFISHLYEGPFVLRNVQNVTRIVTTRRNGLDPKVTSIELPDLLHARFISTAMANLTTLSAPKLISTQRVRITYPAAGSTLDLSSLQSASQGLHLYGGFSKINLNSLSHAGSLIICNKDCHLYPDMEDPPVSAFDLALPSLESAESLDIRGNISSIELPNLETYEDIRVQSYSMFDCDGFKKELGRRAESDVSSIECSSLIIPGSSLVINPGGNAASVTMVLALVAVIIFLVKKKRKPCRCGKGGLSESETGLLSVEREADIPLALYSTSKHKGTAGDRN